jgi:hypothetical protein
MRACFPQVFSFLLLASFNLQSTIALAAGDTPGWTEIKPGGQTSCARGDDFSFFVSEGGDPNKIIIDFMGGGACWNGENCAKDTATFQDKVNLKDYYRKGLTGIYDHNRADNPVKDWTHVVVPYCTGDIHWGSKDVTYKDSSGESFVIKHRGALNDKAVLDWVKEKINSPKDVMVTGCSAGAYGSMYWTPYIRNMYPQSKLIQLADSGAGVITEDFFKASFPNWEATTYAPSWIPSLDPKKVDWNTLSLDQLYTSIGAYYPDVSFSQFNTINDNVQTFFYELMGGDGAAWTSMMMGSMTKIQHQMPNFRSFVGNGGEHCVLPYEHFYTDKSNGVYFKDWFKQFANGESVENVTCENCK